MKYRIIDVTTTEQPYFKGSTLMGTRYDVTYEIDKWSWWKFKVITTTKKAFRKPVGVVFRDSETGRFVSNDLDNLIIAFITVQEL